MPSTSTLWVLALAGFVACASTTGRHDRDSSSGSGGGGTSGGGSAAAAAGALQAGGHAGELQAGAGNPPGGAGSSPAAAGDGGDAGALGSAGDAGAWGGGVAGQGGDDAGPCVDLDHDGYGAGCQAPDCNDADPQVHPDATETPNDGVDQDCDGLERCYSDWDGDGYGGLLDAKKFDCVGPGMLPAPLAEDDCDDFDAGIFSPAQAYQDDDADGFGQGPLLDICSGDFLRLGYATNDDDCDDHDPTVWPAASDAPGDGVDQSCDSSDAPLNEASAIFVDAACKKTCGAGTRASPAVSIDAGLALAQGAQVLVLAEGNYRGLVTTSRSLFGGYARGTWQRDIAAHPTTIAAAADSPQAVYGLSIAADSDVTVSGLRIELTGTGPKTGITADFGASLVLDQVELDASATTLNGGTQSSVRTLDGRLIVSRSRVLAAPVYGTGWNTMLWAGGDLIVSDSVIEKAGANAYESCDVILHNGNGAGRISVDSSSLTCEGCGTGSRLVALFVDTDNESSAGWRPVASARLRDNEFFPGNAWDLSLGWAHAQVTRNAFHEGGGQQLVVASGTVANNVFWLRTSGVGVHGPTKVLHNVFHGQETLTDAVDNGGPVLIANNVFDGVFLPIWTREDWWFSGTPHLGVVAFANDFWPSADTPAFVGNAGSPNTAAAVDACNWTQCASAGSSLSVAPGFEPDGIHLTPKSPLRDRGVESRRWYAEGDTATDFDGDLRDDTPDVGMDEHEP